MQTKTNNMLKVKFKNKVFEVKKDNLIFALTKLGYDEKEVCDEIKDYIYAKDNTKNNEDNKDNNTYNGTKSDTNNNKDKDNNINNNKDIVVFLKKYGLYNEVFLDRINELIVEKG